MTKNKYEMHKQLKLRGDFFRLVMPKASTGYFKFGRKCLEILYKGKKPKKYNCQEVFIGENKELRVCVYTRKIRSGQKSPIIIWIHGGGYGLGIPEMDFSYVKDFLDCSDCVVVAPDYTLSYNIPYPKALNECYETLKWAKEKALELGGNPDCIFVGGDSAGGGLTVALCLLARDKGEVKICFQMPIYPMIDDRETATNVNNTAPCWDSVSNDEGWKIYLQDLYRSENTPYYAVPARCEDYSNMPETVTYIGDLDLFLDETQTMISKLQKAGIKANIMVLEGAYHGFDIVAPKSEVAIKARAFLKEKFINAVKEYNK